MLIYTIDFAVLIISSYRLIEEGGLYKIRELNTLDLIKEVQFADVQFENYLDAKDFVEKINRNKVIIENEDLDLNDLEICIQYHRRSKPQQTFFTLEDVREVILSGDDSISNQVIIDLDGKVKLNNKKKYTNVYAVGYEVFEAGNGYIGGNWSETELRSLYESLLKAWSEHLISNVTIDLELTENYNVELIKKEIEEVINSRF